MDNVIKSDYLQENPIAFCDFAQWSWIESIPMVGNLENITRDVCSEIYGNRSDIRGNFYKDKMDAVTTNSLRQHMN